MNLSVICFTQNGYDRMKELNSIAFEDISVEMFCKCSRLKEECADIYVDEDLSSWTKEQFAKKNGIKFAAEGVAQEAAEQPEETEEEQLLDLCQQYGLLPTGGSDFHGFYNHYAISLGYKFTPEQSVRAIITRGEHLNV